VALPAFDLEYLETLSDAPGHLLSVSERTFYLLLNFVNWEIDDPARFATELQRERYVPLNRSDSEWPLYESVVEQAQLEVSDVTGELIDWLDNITHRVSPYQTISATDSSYTAILGVQSLFNGPVPAGEMWRIANTQVMHNAGACSYIVHATYTPGYTGIYIQVVQPPTNGVWYIKQPDLWLSPGQSITASFNVTTAPTTVYLQSYIEKYKTADEQT
jgi:hypothetical protein